MQFDGMICDEGHFLNSYKSAQSKAVYKIGKKAKKRVVMTGTPVRNTPDQIYGLLHFINPIMFPSYWQFMDRYFKTWETPWGGRDIKVSKSNPDSCYKRKEELQEILDSLSVQRKRSEVMKWIPKKTYQTIELQMDTKQQKAYKDMLETFTVEDIVDAPSVLAQLTRLRQICLAPEVLGIKAPSVKESFVLEWLDDNPTESVIIFSNFSSYLKLLQPKIKGSKLIIGETPKQERQKTVESFQAGKTKVILANLEAAGTGLTLDAGSTVIFLDRSYVPSQNAQAEDRIIPTTENSNSQSYIIDVVCTNSIDQKIHQMLQHKINITKAVNDYKNIAELMNS